MRTKYSIRNIFTITISNVINFIFLFIAQTVFIKILGIEYAGLNGLFNNILTVLSLFELGIGNAIIYNLYKHIHNNDIEQIKSLMNFYKKAYYITAISILGVGLLLTPILPFIVSGNNTNININIVYILFLLSTVASYILAYKRSIIFAHQKNYIINIIHTIYIVVLNITQLFVLFLTKNYYLYLVIKIVFILLENYVINIKANKDYPFLLEKNINKLDIKTKNDVINRVKALFIHKTSYIVTSGTDNILISAFFGIKTVGLYTSYNYIISCIDTFFRNITASTSASVGDLLVESDHEKNYLVFRKINLLNFWITVVTASCLLFLIEPFIKLWLGEKYLLETVVLVVLILNYFQSMMRSTFSIFKDAAGIWVEDKYVPLIQLSLNILFSIICLKIFGLCGIFIGTIISSFAVWFYSYPKFVYKKILNKNYKEYIINVIKYLLLFIIIEVVIYLLVNMIKVKSIILTLIIRLFICLIIANLILFIINRKSSEYNYLEKMILKVLKRKIEYATIK